MKVQGSAALSPRTREINNHSVGTGIAVYDKQSSGFRAKVISSTATIEGEVRISSRGERREMEENDELLRKKNAEKVLMKAKERRKVTETKRKTLPQNQIQFLQKMFSSPQNQMCHIQSHKKFPGK